MISQEQGQAKSKWEFPPVLPGPTTGGGGEGPGRRHSPGQRDQGQGQGVASFFLKSKRSLSAASNTHFVRKKLPAVFFRYNM